MSRTTKQELDNLEKQLNELLGYPTERSPQRESKKNIYWQGVNDYYNIEQICNDGLGARHIAQCLRTKREVAQWFEAAIFGAATNQKELIFEDKEDYICSPYATYKKLNS